MMRGEGPLTGRGLLAMWLFAAVVLGGLLMIAQLTRSPLDDPDPPTSAPASSTSGRCQPPRPPSPGTSRGTVVVDGQSRIHYRTLDPTVAAELPEVTTILAAL